MTPHELVQRIRVAHANHILETTNAAVEEVAGRVGYADAAAFRRVFRAYAGVSPREWRRAAPATRPVQPIVAAQRRRRFSRR